MRIISRTDYLIFSKVSKSSRRHKGYIPFLWRDYGRGVCWFGGSCWLGRICPNNCTQWPCNCAGFVINYYTYTYENVIDWVGRDCMV